MIVEELPINRAKLFTLSPYIDNRGKYVECWDDKKYAKYIPEEVKFVQDDFSRSYQKVLRGLHGDGETWKLIQCIYGTINFVIFDIETKQSFEIILNDSKPQQILVPPQCVNGHLCLSPECIFLYKQSTFYGETKQFTIKWNDPIVLKSGVKWANITSPILSERDLMGPFNELQ